MKFDIKKWRRVWDALPHRIQNEIRAKAKWEHMSLSAVVIDWWPEIWVKVVGKDN